MDGFTACPAYPHPPAQLGPCKGHQLFAQIHRQPGSARRRTAMLDPHWNEGLKLNAVREKLKPIWHQPAFALM